MQGAAPIAAPAVSLRELAAATVGEFPAGAARAQLELSWQQPQDFQGAIFEQARRQLSGFSSWPEATIDLFHDLLEVHVGSGRAAWLSSRDGQGLHALSYGDLVEHSVSLSASWRAQGVAPGQSVCVISALAERRLIGLLAGLHLGVRVSLLQPRGRAHVRNRVSLLACDRVAAEGDMGFYGVSQVPLPLLPQRGGFAPRAAHRYDPTAALLMAVSPLASGSDALCELTALECMTRLLNDALLSLSIGPGERVAAVGREPELVEPSLWLCTLLAGGTFVDLSLQQCRAKPELLTAAGVQVMLAGFDLVPFWLSDPARCGERLRWWSIDPTGAVEFPRCWALFERLATKGVAMAGLVYCAPLGGVVAFSPRALRFDALRVLPAPGLAFELRDVLGAGARVPVDQGALSVGGRTVAQSGGLLLAGGDRAYGLSGALRPRVGGLPYPELEVIALVCEHPAVRHAVVVVVPDPVVMNHGSARLLVFVDPLAGPPAKDWQALCRYLHARVCDELSVEPATTCVEAFALSPRLQDGLVDPVWARGQYVAGLLHRKRALRSFLVLSRLRCLFALDSGLD